MRRPRLLAVVAALGATLTLLASQGTLRAQEAAPLSVSSPLPSWRAPGGRLTVAGTAGPNEVVSLFVGAVKRAETTAAADGRFRLRTRMPHGEDRYRIAVEATRELVVRAEVGAVRVRPLRLAAVGDVNLGDRVALAMAAYGVRYPWLDVARVLTSADLAVANLECAVSTRGSPWPGKQYTFRGKPRALRAMARFAGIDAISLANNHSLDYGRLAFADTLRYAREYGLTAFGGGKDLAAARQPRILSAGGLRVAFLGYSDVRPLGFDAGPTTSGTAPAFPSYIRTDVRRARERADVVVVYFHWGIERTFTPTARQRSLAAVSFDAGAHVVLGAHPHVLQPIERPRRRKLVAWSLGNFVFGATTTGTDRTGILRVKLGSRGVRDYGFRRARIGGPYLVQPQLLR
jgi:hypothetical protein